MVPVVPGRARLTDSGWAWSKPFTHVTVWRSLAKHNSLKSISNINIERRGWVSITSHMCLIYNSRIPEESVAQNSNMYVCVWKRSQEFRNPALVASTHLMCKIRTCRHVCFNFKMQLCMWCRKKAPGIQECLATAPKITCTQFGTPESSGIRIYFFP